MKIWRHGLRKRVHDVSRSPKIPAIMCIASIIAFGWFADRQNAEVFEQNMRVEVRDKLSLVRAKLEGNINGSIQLVRGLVSTISTEPGMSPERFSQLASNLFTDDFGLRSVAAAPDLVITMVHPLAGNERSLGLDYNKNEKQKSAALLARDSRALILAGPVDLVQGGRGFIGRFPVFTEAADGTESFWGLVSAVIDVETLYHRSGLFDADLNIDIAITGADAKGINGTQFFGNPTILEDRPVIADVALPSGSWNLAAVPREGWQATSDNAWQLRGIILFVGLLVLVPILINSRLNGERHAKNRELKRREIELERLSRRLNLALDTSRIGVWELELESGDLVWDDRMNELYGLPTDNGSRAYHHWSNALHPDDLEQAESDFEGALQSRGQYNSEFRTVHPDGSVHHIRAKGAVYTDNNGKDRIIGVNWDVSRDAQLNEELRSARQLAEARNVELETAKDDIEYISLHDALTELPNRRYLDDFMQQLATSRRGCDTKNALLHIDLDRFKQINDTLGHSAGDAMLIHASKVLKSNIRPEDFVARVGGDEFVIVCKDVCDEAFLSKLATRLIENMRHPVSYQEHECRCGVSVGIAVQGDGLFDPKRLLMNADIALYRAKRCGRNRYEFFTEELQAEILKTKSVADEILSGLEQREFFAHFQPQFDATTLDVVGVEALARWHHPEKGVVAPDFFMGAAEELNVVASIDRMILDQSLRQFKIWSQSGLSVPKISVNVSLRRLHDEHLIRSLREMDIESGTVSFELVESIFLDEADDVVKWNIEQLKDLGIEIEIDDFGTGYASIVSLLNLMPRRLKIDRQFIMPIVGSQAQRNLVSSIIDIGKSLDIEVIGEGVETMEHARLLRDMGCDILQGYALARPMSANEFGSFVAAETWRLAS